jgi:HEAT repeat protein
MIRALQEGDENTRIAAAEALGALNMAEAISPLYAALRDQSHLVRDAAYRSLGRISLALGYSLPNVA